jgi:transposase-like protein
VRGGCFPEYVFMFLYRQVTNHQMILEYLRLHVSAPLRHPIHWKLLRQSEDRFKRRSIVATSFETKSTIIVFTKIPTSSRNWLNSTNSRMTVSTSVIGTFRNQQKALHPSRISVVAVLCSKLITSTAKDVNREHHLTLQSKTSTTTPKSHGRK